VSIVDNSVSSAISLQLPLAIRQLSAPCSHLVNQTKSPQHAVNNFPRNIFLHFCCSSFSSVPISADKSPRHTGNSRSPE